jgi:hypothetical protein
MTFFAMVTYSRYFMVSAHRNDLDIDNAVLFRHSGINSRLKIILTRFLTGVTFSKIMLHIFHGK